MIAARKKEVASTIPTTTMSETMKRVIERDEAPVIVKARESKEKSIKKYTDALNQYGISQNMVKNAQQIQIENGLQAAAERRAETSLKTANRIRLKRVDAVHELDKQNIAPIAPMTDIEREMIFMNQPKQKTSSSVASKIKSKLDLEQQVKPLNPSYHELDKRGVVPILNTTASADSVMKTMKSASARTIQKQVRVTRNIRQWRQQEINSID